MLDEFDALQARYVTATEGKRSVDAVPPKRKKKEKTYLLIPFILEDAMRGDYGDICCSIVGEQWSWFCLKADKDCTVRYYQTKMWKHTSMVYMGTTSTTPSPVGRLQSRVFQRWRL